MSRTTTTKTELAPIVLFGTGGHGLQVLEWLEDAIAAGFPYRVVGLLDSDRAKWDREFDGYRVLGDETWFDEHPQTSCIIAIGSPYSKARIARALAKRNVRRPPLIHPSAKISPRATLGEGCIVCPNAVVGRAANLGCHVTVNIGALVAHDATIGPFSHIAPGARIAGGARVGDYADIGAGANVIQLVSIGSHSIIGAGAAVIRDIPTSAVAVGTPARVVKFRPAVPQSDSIGG